MLKKKGLYRKLVFFMLSPGLKIFPSFYISSESIHRDTHEYAIKVNAKRNL